MHYVYVIKSKKWNKPYIGVTNNLKKRITEHNNGKAKYTKNGRPWTLIYYEAFLDSEDAVLREKQLKQHGSAVGFLKKRIKNSMDRA